jgi:hypothetical protein
VEVCGVVPKVMLVGARVQVRPAGVEADRLMVSVKPLMLVRVIVDVPESPARICEGLTGPATIAKSGTRAVTWNVMTAVSWDSEPLVPVTVTVKSVVTVTVALQESVAVWGEAPNVTLAGSVQVRPAGVEDDAERLTVPLKLFSPVTVIVCVIDVPLFPVTVTGDDGLIVKSVTWNMIEAVV